MACATRALTCSTIQARKTMHEFQVLATFAVIAAIYVGLFFAAEKFWMK